MSASVAISIKNLTKIYKVYQRSTGMILELVGLPQKHAKFYALNDISFDVRKGEVVGIVGKNGAGKTTLLRIIGGTLDKTSGSIEISGRVFSLLALGIGFNPELTGRENILMGGLCLGLSHDEVVARTGEVIRFSDLQESIDRPIKTYSSGMLVRLAFSIAVCGSPEILIVDEALSVGDALFSAKCSRRIKEIVASGATVLFVSHDIQTVYELCDRAILLHNGKIQAVGEPRHIGYMYEQLTHEEMSLLNRQQMPTLGIGSAGSTGEKTSAEVLNVSVVDLSGKPTDILQSGSSYRIEVKCKCYRNFRSLTIGFRLQTDDGVVVYGSSTRLLDHDLKAVLNEELTAVFSFDCSLFAGTYFVSGAVAENLGDYEDIHYYNIMHFYADALKLTVLGGSRAHGILNLNPKRLVDGCANGS